jgi:hypothetical protein
MKMTLTDALLHQVKTRPRSAAFIFYPRRGWPPRRTRSASRKARIATCCGPWQLRLIRLTVSTSELRLCSRPGRVGRS